MIEKFSASSTGLKLVGGCGYSVASAASGAHAAPIANAVVTMAAHAVATHLCITIPLLVVECTPAA